jgi:hypothetical protein
MTLIQQEFVRGFCSEVEKQGSLQEALDAIQAFKQRVLTSKQVAPTMLESGRINFTPAPSRIPTQISNIKNRLPELSQPLNICPPAEISTPIEQQFTQGIGQFNDRRFR